MRLSDETLKFLGGLQFCRCTNTSLIMRLLKYKRRLGSLLVWLGPRSSVFTLPLSASAVPSMLRLLAATLPPAALLLLLAHRLRQRKARHPRRIGLIGGLAPPSTIDYYKAINAGVRSHLGGRHSAECVIFSFNQGDVIPHEFENRWDAVGKALAEAGRALEAAGCDGLLICCNSVHHEEAFAALRRTVSVPILHIAEATADALHSQLGHSDGRRRVALLGTSFTAAEGSFFVERLRARGFEVVLDEAVARERLNSLIYDELTVDVVRDEAVAWFATRIERLLGPEVGCEAVVLGCTELAMLLGSGTEPHADRLFDTVQVHAEAAVRFALEPPPAPAASRPWLLRRRHRPVMAKIHRV